MITAIVGGITALGSGLLGLFGTNSATDAQRAIAQTQLEASRIAADAQMYTVDQGAISAQYSALFDLESKEYFSAGLQTGLLIIAIVVVGLIYIMKKSK